MKQALKSLCYIDILADVKKYGSFYSFAYFSKTVRGFIESNTTALEDGDIVVFESETQVSNILADMDILGTIEKMEADGVINRNDYVHDGFFFADAIFSDMDGIINSPIHSNQMMRFCAY